MKLSIIIPAYNEEARIMHTLVSYCAYFRKKYLTFEIIVVLNGCTDGTKDQVEKIQGIYQEIQTIEIDQAGKGLAITLGFKNALSRDNNLIGFVDADLSIQPQYFYQLVESIHAVDGVITSRYMPEARIESPRPWIKRWGSRLMYEPLARLLFGLSYYDLQCGAKLFRRSVIQAIVPYLTITQWSFDVELLHLCKKHKFVIKEIPTIWQDQKGSKLHIFKSGFHMLGSLFVIRMRHAPWK